MLLSVLMTAACSHPSAQGEPYYDGGSSYYDYDDDGGGHESGGQSSSSLWEGSGWYKITTVQSGVTYGVTYVKYDGSGNVLRYGTEEYEMPQNLKDAYKFSIVAASVSEGGPGTVQVQKISESQLPSWARQAG